MAETKNKRTRQRKNGYKSKDRDSKEVSRSDRRVSKSDCANDPKWYMANGQLLKDVSSFNFNAMLGEDIFLRSSDPQVSNYTFTIPGVMSIYTVPTIGISDDNTSPVNLAMRNIYSFVRHANSGHANYDPADLMLYLLAMDNIYTFWSWMTRAIGVANVFSQTSKYMGDGYLRAMGINPNDLRNKFADFRAFINMFAVEASAYAVPNTMSYFIRHSWMYSNIYKDESVDRAQVYMYVPAGLYKYAVDTVTGAGKLVYSPLTVTMNNGSVSAGYLTVDNIMSYGRAMLTALATQEDIGIISGDILKAFGSNNLWRLPAIPEDFAIVPIFSDEVLAQIHHTEFVGVNPCTYVVKEDQSVEATRVNVLPDITQDTNVGGGFLQFKPAFLRANHLTMDKLLDFWQQDITPEMSMVASRNLVTADTVGYLTSGTPVNVLTSCGSELALFANVYHMYQGDFSFYQYWLADDSSPTAAIGSFMNWTRFNEAPMRVIMSPNHKLVSAYFGEIANYAHIDQTNVYNMHRTALLSMFGVPYIP